MSNEATSNNAPLTEGTIFGDFRIERLLGQGGMGQVYLAHQISLDRPAALKILRQELSNDPESADQLIKEARVAAKIIHPNIVQPFAVGEEDGRIFFALEFVNGETAKDYLDQHKFFEAKTAAKIIRDIADGLNYAWDSQKLVHQDIKPDNIMLTASGEAKLMDLGLAKAGSDKVTGADSHEVMGTPQYISPEQLMGEPTSIKSDVYSLGATFYQFLTGEFPFTGDNTDEIVRKHLESAVVPPVDIKPDIPIDLSNLVTRMMDKDPDGRPNGVQVVKILTDFLKRFTTPEVKISIKSSAVASRPAAAAAPEANSRPGINAGNSTGRSFSLQQPKAAGVQTSSEPPIIKRAEKAMTEKEPFKIPSIVKFLIFVVIVGGALYFAVKQEWIPPKYVDIAKEYWEKGRTYALIKVGIIDEEQAKTTEKIEEVIQLDDEGATVTKIESARLEKYSNEVREVQEKASQAFFDTLKAQSDEFAMFDEEVKSLRERLPVTPVEGEEEAISALESYIKSAKEELSKLRLAAAAVADPVAHLQKPFQLEGQKQLVRIESKDGDIFVARSVIDSKEYKFDYSDPTTASFIRYRLGREAGIDNFEFYYRINSGFFDETTEKLMTDKFWQDAYPKVKELLSE